MLRENCKENREDGRVTALLIAMDAQKKAELQHHLNGIAAILYEEADSAELTTLEDIEKNVRNLAQEHVLPQLGIFLSTARPAATLGSSEP
jgi:acylphosphatase